MQKKSISLTVIFIMVVFQVVAQSVPAKPAASLAAPDSKFYIKVDGGYGILTPGSYRITSAPITTSGFSVGSTGLGAGFHIGGGLGYILSDFLNLGLDVDYLKSRDLTANSTGMKNTAEYFENVTIQLSTLSLVPNVTFKALSKPTYFIYTRIGVVFTVHTKFSYFKNDSASYHGTNSPNDLIALNETNSYNNNLNVGVQVAPGIQFQLADHIRGFVELIGNYLPVSPASSVISTDDRLYDINHKLTTTLNSQTNITYVSSGSSNTQQPRVSYNVNSIGINIGVVYRL